MYSVKTNTRVHVDGFEVLKFVYLDLALLGQVLGVLKFSCLDMALVGRGHVCCKGGIWNFVVVLCTQFLYLGCL